MPVFMTEPPTVWITLFCVRGSLDDADLDRFALPLRVFDDRLNDNAHDGRPRWVERPHLAPRAPMALPRVLLAPKIHNSNHKLG